MSLWATTESVKCCLEWQQWHPFVCLLFHYIGWERTILSNLYLSKSADFYLLKDGDRIFFGGTENK